MSDTEFADLVRRLPAEVGEREWVEFKQNNADPQDIGEYLSALSNAARLADQPCGYILWGVEDGTRRRVGTTFQPREQKYGNEELEHWLTVHLNPQVEVAIREGEVEGRRHVLVRVAAAGHAPTAFKGERFIRVGTYKKLLAKYPDHEKRLFQRLASAPFDELPALTDVTAAEVLRLLDDVEMHRLQNRPLPDTTPARLDALAKCQAVLAREGGRFDVTTAGALLLARQLSEFGSHLGRKAVRIVHYRGLGKSEPVGRPDIDAGYAVGIGRAVELLQAMLSRGGGDQPAVAADPARISREGDPRVPGQRPVAPRPDYRRHRPGGGRVRRPGGVHQPRGAAHRNRPVPRFGTDPQCGSGETGSDNGSV